MGRSYRRLCGTENRDWDEFKNRLFKFKKLLDEKEVTITGCHQNITTQQKKTSAIAQ